MVATVPSPSPYSASNNTSPGFDATAIVPSNTVNNPIIYRAVWVGSAGDVSLVTAAGNTAIFYAATAGSIIPVQCARVNVLNTTASLLVGII